MCRGNGGRSDLSQSRSYHSRSQLFNDSQCIISLRKYPGLHFILQKRTTAHNNKPIHHCTCCERLAIRHFRYAFRYWCADLWWMDLWWNDVRNWSFLRLFCRVRITRYYELNSNKPILQDLPIGSAIQEVLFTVEVTNLVGLCVDLCCLLRCDSKVGWSSRLCVRSGIWHLCPRLSKRNWQNNQLLHCPWPIARVSFNSSHRQLHKSCKDDPTT